MGYPEGRSETGSNTGGDGNIIEHIQSETIRKLSKMEDMITEYVFTQPLYTGRVSLKINF